MHNCNEKDSCEIEKEEAYNEQCNVDLVTKEELDDIITKCNSIRPEELQHCLHVYYKHKMLGEAMVD